MATSPRNKRRRSAEELRQDRGEEQSSTWFTDRTAEPTTHREQGREPVVPKGPREMGHGETTEEATQTVSGTKVSESAAVQVDPSTIIEQSRRLDTRAPMRYSRCVTDQVEEQDQLSGRMLVTTRASENSTTGVQATAAPTTQTLVHGTDSTTRFPRGAVGDLDTLLEQAARPSQHSGLEDGDKIVEPKERHGKAPTMAALEGRDRGDLTASENCQQDPGEGTTQVNPSDMVNETAGEDLMEIDSEITGAEETESPTGFLKFAQQV